MESDPSPIPRYPLLAPVERCLHTLAFLAPVTDTTVTQRVPEALDELEAAYRHPADRAAVLRSLMQKVCPNTADVSQTPFQRFVIALAEQRLKELNRFSALQGVPSSTMAGPSPRGVEPKMPS